MMRKPVSVLLLIVALLLVSCGPAVKPAAGPEAEGGEVFTIALPRLVIDFDQEGTPSVMGVDLNVLASWTGFDPRSVQLNRLAVNGVPAIDWMRAANVQHIEMRQGGNGVYVFVNGKPMPFLGWSDASLAKASDVAALFDQGTTERLRKFLPLVRRLGLDLVLRFPRDAGVAEIPLADPSVQLAAKPSGRAASAIVQFEVKYDQNGTPAVLGITPYDLQAMGLPPMATNLRSDYVQWLQQNNIQTVELRGKEDGLFVYLNGEPLPNIVWDDTFLDNAASVYGQMNSANQPVVALVKGLLPLVNKADVGVLVHFPVAPGKAVVPAKMHE